MRTAGLFAILLVAFLSSPRPAAAEDHKIGYVHMARALNEVGQGKTAKAKLKKDFEQKQIKLDKMQKDLKAKKDQFEARKGMMKPEARLEKKEELQTSFLKLQQTYMELQQELMGREAKITQEIAGKLRAVIAKIGDRDGYTLVLDIGDTVLYYKRHRDLTDLVVKEYNQQYGKK